MTRTLSLPAVPPWTQVSDGLKTAGHPVQMRMIDGQPAFPDEAPPESWRELRVSGGGRMVTIRRTASGVELVMWGNADEPAIALRDAIAAAFETAQ